MRLSTTSALLGQALLVSGAVIPETLAPAAPLSAFPSHDHNVIQPEELFNALAEMGIEVVNNITNTLTPLVDGLGLGNDKVETGTQSSTKTETTTTTPTPQPTAPAEAKTESDPEVKSESVSDSNSDSVSSMSTNSSSGTNSSTKATDGTCTSPRERTEWDSYSNEDKHAYVDAINCLRKAPSAGDFAPSASRYEDLVRLHQLVTPVVHDNSKFLVWHRYFMWVYEDVLRTECGFDRNLPWWDEGKNGGKFTSSSVFSTEFYGALAIGGDCVTDGVFANTNLNVGPGEGNTVHCLSRAGDSKYTGQITEDLVNAVNSWPEYKDMAHYAEGTFHAYGHLGVGGVQADKYASPGDPWFFLHHGYVDRNFAIWQKGDSAARTSTISGTDIDGVALTLDTNISMHGLRPDITVRDIMSTTAGMLCYQYQY